MLNYLETRLFLSQVESLNMKPARMIEDCNEVSQVLEPSETCSAFQFDGLIQLVEQLDDEEKLQQQHCFEQGMI